MSADEIGETRPLRSVVKSSLRGGNTGLAEFKSHWWNLILDCGHETERNVRWRRIPNPPRGWAALHRPPSLDRLPDPPKRARCSECRADQSGGTKEPSMAPEPEAGESGGGTAVGMGHQTELPCPDHPNGLACLRRGCHRLHALRSPAPPHTCGTHPGWPCISCQWKASEIRQRPESLHEKLEHLAALEEGWDSYGGPAIDHRAITAARTFIDSMDVSPTVHGGVEVFWLSEAVTIEFGPDGDPTGFGFDLPDTRSGLAEWGSVRPVIFAPEADESGGSQEVPRG